MKNSEEQLINDFNAFIKNTSSEIQYFISINDLSKLLTIEQINDYRTQRNIIIKTSIENKWDNYTLKEMIRSLAGGFLQTLGFIKIIWSN